MITCSVLFKSLMPRLMFVYVRIIYRVWSNVCRITCFFRCTYLVKKYKGITAMYTVYIKTFSKQRDTSKIKKIKSFFCF